MENQTVAIIGAGPAGLVVAKNLLESYSEDENATSTLKSTISNVSKFGNSFTDFPIPDDMPAHLTAAQTCDYIQSYAKHSELEQYVSFNTSVTRIERNKQNTEWTVMFKHEKTDRTEVFDKVVLCSGITDVATMPKIEGIELFKGRSVHVQCFKRPDDFKDQRVLVVGIGNSAADTSTQLIGHASKIYLSHRGGVKILPRVAEGKPLDLVISRQLNLVKYALDRYLPAFSRWAFDYTIEGHSKKAFPNLDPSWRLAPAPSLANHQPVISDNLVSSLREKKVTSVHGIKRFLGENEVELSDGTKLEIDSVVWCTGYKPNFSVFKDYDPMAPLSSPASKMEFKRVQTTDEPRLAHLYQNIFPPQYASSLAFMNYCALTDGAITVFDLMAMAIAQIWNPTHPYPLPSPEEMADSIAQHHAWVRSLTRSGTDTAYTGIVRPGPFTHFLNEAAGTGVDDYLSYGIEGWKFWLKDRKMCGLMMKGVMTPFMYRYFEAEGREESSRRRWKGARDAILHSNELASVYKK